jgi:hypothetical protein
MQVGLGVYGMPRRFWACVTFTGPILESAGRKEQWQKILKETYITNINIKIIYSLKRLITKTIRDICWQITAEQHHTAIMALCPRICISNFAVTRCEMLGYRKECTLLRAAVNMYRIRSIRQVSARGQDSVTSQSASNMAQTVTLSNNYEFPIPGLGTFKVSAKALICHFQGRNT